MAEPPPLEFDRVEMDFDGVPAVRGLSLRVEHGETKVLLGEAGAGKSVVLKLAIGLLRPRQGEVRLFGQPTGTMSETELFALRRRVGIVFQESALFDSLTVFDNVAYRLEEEESLDPAAIAERVHTCLRFVELEDVVDKMPGELSGGMRRRVAIARALATEPEVMLYDSPTGGLDPVTAATIVELIVKLRDVNQVTSLLVTHRLQDAFVAASHIWDEGRHRLEPAPPDRTHVSFLLLHNGSAVFDGGVPELRASQDPYLKQFLR